MKKSKLKKLGYRLIARESDAGRTLYAILEDLVEAHHPELRLARIVLAWNLTWKPDTDGRVVLGKCKKATDLDRELMPVDFVIMLSQEFFQDARVSDLQRTALIDHELYHAAVKYDDRGEPVLDERLQTVYRTRKHDLEEFSEIAERYGCWKKDLEDFARALERAPQTITDWVGYTMLQTALVAVDRDVSLDVIRAWTDQERRDVMAWAFLQRELSAKPIPGTSAVMPEILAAALDDTLVAVRKA